MTPKPASLDIVAENGKLVGTDQNGRRWYVGWCGNGQYSHWVLRLVDDVEVGWYVYKYPENTECELKEQIQAAEHKYKIYS
jgi:hypothetical protein